MTRRGRTAGALALAVIAGLAIAASVFIEPDLPRAVLIAKYADARSRFVTLADGTVAHVRVEGPAGRPVLVLLHGAMSSLQTWRPWAQRLSADYQVISLDLPGHGLTGPTAAADYSRDGMVAFVHAVLTRMGVRHEAMIGHSMGGGVAAEYAERYPGEVWALVLIDAAGVPRHGPETAPARAARNPFLRPLLRWVLPRWVIADGLRKTYGDPSKLTDQAIDQIHDLERYPGNRAGMIGHYLAKDNDAAVAAALPTITAPTLILWGGADPVLPLESGKAFQHAIRGAQLIVYPGVGHTVIDEAPEPSERDAALFLSRVRPGAPTRSSPQGTE